MYLMLIVFTSTGIMFINNAVMGKDILVMIIILFLYGVYAMLYILYGSIMSFFVALIYLICLIYVCKRTALLISKMASLIYDMEHATIIQLQAILIPRRKLEVTYWFRMYSVLLLTCLIAGNLLEIILFLNYQWIPELYNQGFQALNFIVLLYLFRSTSANQNLYEQVFNRS